MRERVFVVAAVFLSILGCIGVAYYVNGSAVGIAGKRE